MLIERPGRGWKKIVAKRTIHKCSCIPHIPPIVAKLRGTIMINHQIFKIPDFWTDLDILFVHTSYDYDIL